MSCEPDEPWHYCCLRYLLYNSKATYYANQKLHSSQFKGYLLRNFKVTKYAIGRLHSSQIKVRCPRTKGYLLHNSKVTFFTTSRLLTPQFEGYILHNIKVTYSASKRLHPSQHYGYLLRNSKVAFFTILRLHSIVRISIISYKTRSFILFIVIQTRLYVYIFLVIWHWWVGQYTSIMVFP